MDPKYYSCSIAVEPGSAYRRGVARGFQPNTDSLARPTHPKRNYESTNRKCVFDYGNQLCLREVVCDDLLGRNLSDELVELR